MNRLFLACFLLLVASSAYADGTIEGTIDLGKGPFLVYVEKIAGKNYLPPAESPLMNQKGNTYLPHILPVLAGTKVEFKSADPELHNIYARVPALSKVIFNIGIPPGAPPMYRTFPEPAVVRLTCNVHKEMLAFIVVLQNPHFVLLEKGATSFRLEGVPDGDHQVRVWGEKLSEAVLARSIPAKVTGGAAVQVQIAEAQVKS